MPVSYLVYVSQADSRLTPKDLEEILAESRGYNTDRGITGILLYAEGRGGSTGSFMQLLEGEEDELEHLRERIFGDPRHHTKIVLERGEKPARDFPDWSMAFKITSASELARHAQFADLGEAHFHQRCAAGEVEGALEFLCDFWDEAA